MRRALVVLTVPALVLAALSARAQTRVEQSRPAAADALVDIENMAGSIRVTGWDKNEIAVTGKLGRHASGLQFSGGSSHTRIEVETEVSLHASDGGAPKPLAADTETAIYRVVQEALTNVAKHAHATQAFVRLHLADDRAQLTVEDNGRGVSAHGNRDGDSHLGWLGMRERLTAVNGTLSMGVAADGGLRIDADIPLE